MTTYCSYTDAELTTLLKDGDRVAYAEIYERYKNLLYINAFKKTGNSDDAQDIIQEVFIMLWAKHKKLVINKNLASFLYTCIHHKVLDLFTHQKIDERHVTKLKDFLLLTSNNTDYNIREKQLALIIEREIAALPEKMREVFVLSRYEGLSQKEIALTMNISEETVKSQVKNALKILRTKLGLFTFLLFLIRF
ncbi:RNA polymerase sigma factor [Pedobacter heparinus]|uniref:RNA polymerase sigma-70 factor n=1 Tax=Pedobacter heparinus (strain ATCC 13125 / DSM 2366 / CIP 104194 / JCM 7457 / NBRC 12017 / NCIMB 9290 / NRRL B-14731 / HIM 762-3) TaxID=485917 RepID=C6Y1Q7_PEDHD|nr:RNA polymerase sigma-70 factor [Pedobacter heparinus]ACU05049.1 RNA polymerase sigma-70 factor [Pedobacter heparinus DSM 2366]